MNSKVIPDKSKILMSDFLKEEVDIEEQFADQMLSVSLNTIFHFSYSHRDEADVVLKDKSVTVVGLLSSYKLDKTINNKFEVESRVEVSDAIDLLTDLNPAIGNILVKFELHKGESVTDFGEFAVTSAQVKLFDQQSEMCILLLTLAR